MMDFNTELTYIFVGKIDLIENHKRTDKMLGKFIEYKSITYCGDIFPDGKAVFEYGTISSGLYQYVNVYNN